MTYRLIGHTLAKYPAKILPKANTIKGIAMRMGASWHCKMSCLNEFVGVKKVLKNKQKEWLKIKKTKTLPN